MSKSAPPERHRGGRAFRPALGAMEAKMKFMLLIYSEEAALIAMRQAEGGGEQVLGAYMAYTDALKEAGVYVGGERLRASDAATTVRIADGKTQVLNGPYAETREQLG